MSIKVEKILKGRLDWIPSPWRSVKIQIMGSKVCLRRKVNGFPFHSRRGWWDWIQAAFLNLFYFNIQLVCSEKAKKSNQIGIGEKKKRKKTKIWKLFFLGRYLITAILSMRAQRLITSLLGRYLVISILSARSTFDNFVARTISYYIDIVHAHNFW